MIFECFKAQKKMINSMLKKLMFCSLLFLNMICFSQNTKDYEGFKIGIFQYEANGELIEIKRTKKKHVETYNNGNSKLILKVKWLDESTLLLIYKRSVNAPGCLKKGDWVKVEILKINGDIYTCKVSSEKCGTDKADIIKRE